MTLMETPIYKAIESRYSPAKAGAEGAAALLIFLLVPLTTQPPTSH